MVQTKKQQATGIYDRVIKILSSKYFFYLILLLAITQGLWYALSFQPGLFDESKHLGKIVIYSHHVSPFLGTQDPSWDEFGPVTRDSSYLFYYIMSWPLRFIQIFTQNTTLQIIGLRMVCLSFFVAGLVVFRKVLLGIKDSSKALVHVSLLLFVLTPAFGPLAGAVNYDNLVFLLFAALLLYSLRVVKSTKLNSFDLMKAMAICLVMAVVKWAAVALIIPVVIYLMYDVYTRYRKELVPVTITALKELPKLQFLFVLFGFIVLGGLFIERPVINTLRYGGVDPDCKKVLSNERCMNFRDYKVYVEVDAKKPQGFQPVLLPKYFTTMWFPRMTNTQTTLLPWESDSLTPALPIIENAFFSYTIIGPLLIALFLREMWGKPDRRYLLIVASGYALILCLFLYRSYVRHAIPAAINARYLLPVLPIFIYFSSVSLSNLLGSAKKTKLFVLVGLALVTTQGGGIITHALTAPSSLYWKNQKVQAVNTHIRSILSPLVKEKF